MEDLKIFIFKGCNLPVVNYTWTKFNVFQTLIVKFSFRHWLEHVWEAPLCLRQGCGWVHGLCLLQREPEASPRAGVPRGEALLPRWLCWEASSRHRNRHRGFQLWGEQWGGRSPAQRVPKSQERDAASHWELQNCGTRGQITTHLQGPGKGHGSCQPLSTCSLSSAHCLTRSSTQMT